MGQSIANRCHSSPVFFLSFHCLQLYAALKVGEGGLPDGAKQFESLVRAKREWNKLGKSIATRHEEYR